MKATTINWSDVETVQPVSDCNQFAREIDRVSLNLRLLDGISLKRIYRKELKLYRRMAQFIDQHPTLTNLWIGGWGMAMFIYILLFY